MARKDEKPKKKKSFLLKTSNSIDRLNKFLNNIKK